MHYPEFKIGNWVRDIQEGNYCTIKSLYPELILSGAVKDYPSTIESIGKIEITEDKLQVCGFDIQDSRCIKKSVNDISVVLEPKKLGIYTIYSNDEEFGRVRFIHQVQNAYFDITGELLEGNLYGVRERRE